METEQVELLELDAAQPVLAAGQSFGLVEDEIDALGQGQRHHGEVDAAGADGHPADDQAEQCGQHNTCRNCQVPRPGVMHHDDAGAIAAHPKESGMAEREHAGVAEQQVESHCVQAEDQDVDRQRLVRHQPGEEDQKDDDRRHAVARDEVQYPTLQHQLINPARPNSPWGRTSSTRAISTKIDVSAKSGIYSDDRL